MNCFTLCRLCLSSNYDFYNIFSEKSIGDNLNQKLYRYLNLEVKDDDTLPHIICVKCFERIEHFHVFSEQVQTNQNVLISLVQPVLNVMEKTARNVAPSDYIKIETIDLNNDLAYEDGTIYKIGTLYKVEENSNGITMVETSSQSQVATSQTSLIVLNSDLNKANTEICNTENVTLIQEIAQKPISYAVQYEQQQTDSIPDFSENGDTQAKLMNDGETESDSPEEEPEESETDSDGSVFDQDESPLERDLSDRIINTNFPTEIIKGSRLLIRGKELVALMSRFYRLECDSCPEKGVTFEKLKDLCKHYKDVHAKKGYVTCCGVKIFKSRGMAMHMSRHIQPEAFRCPECKKMMTCPKILKYHIQNHLPEEKRPLPCPDCPRRFSYSSALLAHALSHLPENERAAHICDECGKSFLSAGRLATHMTVVHTKNEQAFVCHICAKRFSCKGNLAYHLTTHQPKLYQVQCEQCDKWLKNKLCLRKHMIQHSSVLYSCDQCSYSTQNVQRLRNHTKIQHTDAKPFACETCHKTFKIKNNLLNHMVMHTGVKKFQCEFCSRTFASSGNYYSHRKRMHPNELALAKLEKEEQDEKLRKSCYNL